MLTLKLQSIMLVSIVLSSNLIGLPHLVDDKPIVLRTSNAKEGALPSPEPLEKVYDCTASHLSFINCSPWLNHVPNDGDYKKTIMVIDQGIPVDQWASLQIGGDNNYYVDILSYWTWDVANRKVVTYGYQGSETFDYLSNIEKKLGYNTAYKEHTFDHTFWVLSALASIARGAKVIIVDIKTFDTDYGLSLGNGKFWDFLLANIDSLNVGVIVTAIEWPSSAQNFYNSHVKRLYSKGIFMVTAIGNQGRDESRGIPNSYPEFFPVSSIDHENRGEWRTIGGTYLFYENYYSSTGSLSGRSEYGISNCHDWKNARIICSSWGSTSRPVRFAMPAHFITLMSYYFQGRVYPAVIGGTSIAAPMLAAAALVAIYAFNLGHYKTFGWYESPSLNLLVRMLERASSQPNNPDQFLGVGFINLGRLFDIAYSEGLNFIHPLSSGGNGNWL